MKKAIFCIFALFACVGIFAQQQYTVAVTPFDLVGGSVSREEADVIYELFVTELSNISGIRVVDRNSFDRITAQMQFQVSDWSNNNKVAEFGKALNADCIIRGQFMSLSGRLILNARIVDVNTTEILSAAPLQLINLDELFEKLPAYVANVVKNLPPKSYRMGDKGPGGGIIFFAEGGQYIEISPDLGSETWVDANRMARNYRGGGFTDWRLPSSNEFPFIYRNLILTGRVTVRYAFLWSADRDYSSRGTDTFYWVLDPDKGTTSSFQSYYPLGVYAVRSFRQ